MLLLIFLRENFYLLTNGFCIFVEKTRRSKYYDNDLLQFIYKHALVIRCVRYHTFHENVCYLYSTQLHPAKNMYVIKLCEGNVRRAGAHRKRETILHKIFLSCSFPYAVS